MESVVQIQECLIFHSQVQQQRMFEQRNHVDELTRIPNPPHTESATQVISHNYAAMG